MWAANFDARDLRRRRQGLGSSHRQVCAPLSTVLLRPRGRSTPGGPWVAVHIGALGCGRDDANLVILR